MTPHDSAYTVPPRHWPLRIIGAGAVIALLLVACCAGVTALAWLRWQRQPENAIVGTWERQLPDGTKVEMEFTANGKFARREKFTNLRQRVFEGDYHIAGNQLEMVVGGQVWDEAEFSVSSDQLQLGNDLFTRH